MAMKTLPDAVRGGLRALAVGINPSLPSVRAGFYFANPRNRFWPALNASRLVDAPLPPGPQAVEVLVERYGIGFTDVVKRPTAGSAELRAREYREGAVRLEALVLRHEPAVVWFQGAQAWRAFAPPCRMGRGRKGAMGATARGHRPRPRVRHPQSEPRQRLLWAAGARAVVRCGRRVSSAREAYGTTGVSARRRGSRVL